MPTTELEQRIMQAAEQLFLEKGFAQTSTTDIAREAGCTQALVHYYYRTKDKLFTTIFNQKLEQLLNAAQQCEYDGDFTAYMKHLLDIYFAMISANRQLPAFIINELVLNKERREFIREHVIQNAQRQAMYYKLDSIVKTEIRKGTIRNITTPDLLLDTVSLVVMSFMTLPIYTDLLQCTTEQTETYLRMRKEEITELLLRGLSAEKTK